MDKNSLSQNANENNQCSVETGNYYKFTSIIFPPCIIRNKNKIEKSLSSNENISITNRNNNKDIFKYKKNDFLLKTYGELKNDIIYELEQKKNSNDINGLDAMRKIAKKIEQIKQHFALNKKRQQLV